MGPSEWKGQSAELPARGPGSPPVPTAPVLGKGHTEHGHEEVYGENVLKTQEVLIPRRTNKSLFVFKILHSRDAQNEDGQRELVPLCETCARISVHAHFWI